MVIGLTAVSMREILALDQPSWAATASPVSAAAPRSRRSSRARRRPRTEGARCSGIKILHRKLPNSLHDLCRVTQLEILQVILHASLHDQVHEGILVMWMSESASGCRGVLSSAIRLQSKTP